MGVGFVKGAGFGYTSLSPFLISITSEYLNPIIVIGIIVTCTSLAGLGIKETLG